MPDPLSEELLKLARQVRDVGENLEDEHKVEFTSLSDRAISLAHSVRAWLGHALDGQVYWVDLMPGAPPKIGYMLPALISAATRSTTSYPARPLAPGRCRRRR